MISKTENQQMAKSVCPDEPAWRAEADPRRLYAVSTMCCFFRGTAHIFNGKGPRVNAEVKQVGFILYEFLNIILTEKHL